MKKPENRQFVISLPLASLPRLLSASSSSHLAPEEVRSLTAVAISA
jgi:hypothetical protein